MITMSEIAKLANVSQPTVSRVLNGNPKVAPEIRDRVLAIAKAHNYQLNVLARSLQGGKTQLFGLIVTDISNSFFAELAKNLEIEARKQGYSIILFNSGYDLTLEQEYMEVVRRYRVDGVLAVPIQSEKGTFLDGVEKLDVPVVCVTRSVPGLDSVYLDHEEAGTQVAHHLVQKGYERFLFIGRSWDRKYWGLQEGLVTYGLADRTSNLEYHDDEQLKADLQRYLRLSPNRPGIFAGNDIFALRVLGILQELGISIPDSVGVIGFDDTFLCRYLSPTLSSVSQPVAEISEKAVSQLLWRINNPGVHPVLNRSFHGTLIARGST